MERGTSLPPSSSFLTSSNPPFPAAQQTVSAAHQLEFMQEQSPLITALTTVLAGSGAAGGGMKDAEAVCMALASAVTKDAEARLAAAAIEADRLKLERERFKEEQKNQKIANLERLGEYSSDDYIAGQARENLLQLLNNYK
mmetsp:Transcript_15731/g.51597  ORF Transcript_15731/g.51597 Transcript_15731/m.51597 type:complete len:141 (-) Transcript_15731:26-448(-)